MTQKKRLTSLEDLSMLLPEDGKSRELPVSVRSGHDGKGKVVRVSLEKSGRKGKIVTIISGLQHNPDTMEEIARTLKQTCGAGGTVKGMTIEIQGDNRERVKDKLKEMKYEVK